MNGTDGPDFYFDTNIFIQTLEGTGPLSQRLADLLAMAEEGAVRIATSILTLSELLVLPIRLEHHRVTETYRQLLTSGVVETEPLSAEIAVLAAAIRAANSALKLPDAIHLATAHHVGAAHFVTSDRHLRLPVRLPDPAHHRHFDLAPPQAIDPQSPEFSDMLTRRGA